MWMGRHRSRIYQVWRSKTNRSTHGNIPECVERGEDSGRVEEKRYHPPAQERK